MRDRQSILPGATKFYRVEPSVFNEMRLQLIVAILFVLFVAVSRFVPRLAFSRSCDRAIRIYGVLIMVLILNISCFLALMSYREDREIPRALLGMLFGNGNIEGPKGVPLLFQQPRYGFYIFAVSLAAMCLSVWTRNANALPSTPSPANSDASRPVEASRPSQVSETATGTQ